MVWRWAWATVEWQWRLHDDTQKMGKSWVPWCICNWLSFMQPFLLGPVFFQTALPCSGGYYLERGGMKLQDAVRINCLKRLNYVLKIKALVSSIWINRCILDDCVCYLTWHDYPSLVEGESHGVLLLLTLSITMISLNALVTQFISLLLIFYVFLLS